MNLNLIGERQRVHLESHHTETFDGLYGLAPTVDHRNTIQNESSLTDAEGKSFNVDPPKPMGARFD